MHSEDLTPLRLHLTMHWLCERSFSPHMEHKQRRKRWHSCALPNVKLLLGFTWTLCLKVVANRQWIWLVREILTKVALRAPNIFEHLKQAVIWRGVWFGYNVPVSSSCSLVWGLIHESALVFNAGGGMKWRWVSCPMTSKKRLIPQLHFTPWTFMLHPVRIQLQITMQNNMHDSNEEKKYARGSVSLLLLEWESD